MLEEYKDIESAADIPVFSGDHWAASIALKMAELKSKDKEKKKGSGTAVPVNGNGVSAPRLADNSKQARDEA